MLFHTRLALARKEAHNRKKEKELQVEDGLILLKANALLIVLHWFWIWEFARQS